MSPAERALRTIRSQVQFEMAEVVGHVASALARAEEAKRLLHICHTRQENAVRSMRRALQPFPNPALRVALGGEYDVAERTAALWNSRLSAARQQEDEARTTLAQLRHRDRGLTRSIEQERKKQMSGRQRSDYLLADEYWLHTERAR